VRFYFPIALTALATTVYHVAQKSIPRGADPVVSLVMTYVTALAVSLAALPFAPRGDSFARAVTSLNWGSYAVGVAIVAVELAVLLAYRAGWRISLASVVANVTTAVLLVGVGLVVYREHLRPQHVVGLLLCLAGLVLAAQP
jgi:drug/metabolite transporter (DMT)-like permease